MRSERTFRLGDPSPRCLPGAILTFAIGAVLAPAQGDPRAFRDKFEKAAAAEDYTLMRQLVSEDRDLVIRAASGLELDICLANVKAEAELSEKIENNYDELAQAYRLQYSDNLLTERRKWLKSLDVDDMKARVDAIKAWDQASAKFNEGIESGGDIALKEAIQGYVGCFQQSSKIKDHYTSARCWRAHLGRIQEVE